MSLQKVGLKVPVKGEVDTDAVMKAMVAWIRDDRIDGTLIDVADYSHMKNGPGIVLVGHEFMISLDEQDGYVGLRVAHRLPSDKKLNVRMLECVQTLRQGTEALKADLGIESDGEQIEVFISDRLNADDSTASELQSALEEATGLKGSVTDGEREARRLPGVTLKLTPSII
jgi:hypothetical protein